MQKLSRFQILGFVLITLVLILGLVLGILSAKQNQDKRSQAAPVTAQTYTITYGKAGDMALVGKTPTDSGYTPTVVRDNGVTWIGQNQTSLSIQLPANVPTNASKKYLLCDLMGTGVKTPVIFVDGTFYYRSTFTSGVTDQMIVFGAAGDIPVCGDWTGSGKQTIGVVRGGNTWLLRKSNTTGFEDIKFIYGLPTGDVPIVGHWQSGKIDYPGVFRAGFFLLRNSFTTGGADIMDQFGNAGDQPIVGDWDNSGRSSLGVVQGNTWQLREEVTPSPSPASATDKKVLMADFYWYFPWYGLQRPVPCPAPNNQNPYGCINPSIATPQGNVDVTTTFPDQPSEPIPYLQSNERPTGDPDPNGTRATKYFKDSFSRAADAGIQVMVLLARPDLAKEPTAIAEMVDAQRQLRGAGKPFPKLMFMADGTENWDNNSQLMDAGEQPNPSSGTYTSTGVKYSVVKNGLFQIYDQISRLVTPSDFTTYFFTYPDQDTFPLMVYRVEGNSQNVQTDNQWTTQLKADFAKRYPTKNLYLVLDDLWCNNTYGVNNSIHTATCNADNYFHWGDAIDGVNLPTNSRQPYIVTVGPGYNETKIRYPGRTNPRNNGQTYKNQIQAAINLNAKWILLETFNFGIEGSMIDNTTDYGSKYLDLTKQYLQPWLNN